MKKIYIFLIFLCSLAATVVSCHQEEQLPEPEIVLADSVMTANPEGGDYAFSYTVTDPAEDGRISAETSGKAGWISNISTEEPGSVNFTVSRNDSGQERTAEINVTYTWSIGERTAVIQVEQQPVSEEPGDEPALEWSLERDTVDAAGGAVDLTYTLDNPVEDGTLTISSEAQWLTLPETVSDGKVSVEAEANDTEESREAVITLEYTFCTGTNCRMIKDELFLTQLGSGSEIPVPAIKVNSSEVKLSSSAGDKVFGYWIENPAEDGEVSVESGTEWLGEFDCSTPDEIHYTVSGNDTGEERTGSFTIIYTYDGDKSVRKEIDVIQSSQVDIPEPTDDVKFDFNFEYSQMGSQQRVTITVTADNQTSRFMVGQISVSEFENSGKTWYEVAYDKMMNEKTWADLLGGDISQYSHQGEYQITILPNDLNQYVFAFAVSDDWTVTSEVQYATMIAPVLSLGTGYETHFTADGGTGAIPFTVRNNVEGAVVTASTDAGWIALGQPAWDSSVTGAETVVDGTVDMTVVANTLSESRTGSVVITYTAEGKSQTREVVITQDAPVLPDISWKQTEELAFSPDGGEGTIEFTVTDNVAGSSLTAGTDCDWLSVGQPSWDNSVTGSPIDGSLTVTASANPSGITRTGKVSLTYTAGGQTKTISLSVYQSPAVSDEGCDIAISVLECPYPNRVKAVFDPAESEARYYYNVFPKKDFADAENLEASLQSMMASAFGSFYSMYESMYGQETALNFLTGSGRSEIEITYTESDPAEYYVVAVEVAVSGDSVQLCENVSYVGFSYPLE